MYVGYARVSTQDQHLDLQQDALRQAGCTRIIVDRVSGTVAERPGLAKLKDILRADDTLVVWRLDRLGRSLKDLIAWVAWLEQEGIGLRAGHADTAQARHGKGARMAKKSLEAKRADKTRPRAKKRHPRPAQRSSPPLGAGLGGFPFGDVPDAPPGFRPLPMTQAMLEF